MPTVSIISVSIGESKEERGDGLAGLGADVYTVVAVIECHGAPVQENLVRYLPRPAFATSLLGVDETELFFHKNPLETTFVSVIASVDGRAGAMNTGCVTAIIVVVNKSLVCLDAIPGSNIPFARGVGAFTVAISLQQSAGLELGSRECLESGSAGIALVDSDAGGDIGAKDDVWEIENRRCCALGDYHRQGKRNKQLEKHDGRTKNTVNGC